VRVEGTRYVSVSKRTNAMNRFSDLSYRKQRFRSTRVDWNVSSASDFQQDVRVLGRVFYGTIAKHRSQRFNLFVRSMSSLSATTYQQQPTNHPHGYLDGRARQQPVDRSKVINPWVRINDHPRLLHSFFALPRHL